MTLPVAYPPLPDPLPSPVIDSHCHLDIGAAGRDGERGLAVDTALAAGEAVGVDAVIQVGVDVASSREAVRIAHDWAQVVAAVALHPNEAPRIDAEHGRPNLQAAWQDIAELATDDRVVAIGETGMDFFRTDPPGRAVQEESFRRHIDLAKHLDKTLVIHDRDAHADILRIMDDEGAPRRVVMHCFSGDAAFAEAVTQRGWFCSFAGVVTFKNAGSLREALAVVPRDRILVETDAPFLAPMPYRGKPNASYLIPWTIRLMSEHLSADLDELCQTVRDNTFEAFGAF
ncbi:MAG TPA: TatD family hydrolase [Actinomycetota bacterium]|nr:TatD family hydrolase [Candidatus Nanopelagicales bacterium]HPE11570.1 TatD family hydrolase [Actinomycetota bacterium]HPJ19839.1 TatD family hydrolase [Actinomycetota bacterium]HPQ83230.1 TatD family hydrolase [Actinomycetota bacterium]HRV65890.1 TatD family hydrolase [Candidatus Nanopelagicales bacterium]